MIPWFIAFLFLALLNYYFGFVDRGNNPFRFLSAYSGEVEHSFRTNVNT
jgi:hypothetical protein